MTHREHPHGTGEGACPSQENGRAHFLMGQHWPHTCVDAALCTALRSPEPLWVSDDKTFTWGRGSRGASPRTLSCFPDRAALPLWLRRSAPSHHLDPGRSSETRLLATAHQPPAQLASATCSWIPGLSLSLFLLPLW